MFDGAQFGEGNVSHSTLRVSIRQASPEAALTALAGVVTAEAEAALVEALQQAAGRGARFLVVDLSGVFGIDSGGASSLLKLWAAARSRRVRLVAAAPDAGIRDILDLTQLSEVVSVFADLDRAFSAARAAAGQALSGPVSEKEVTWDAGGGASRGSVVHWARPVRKLQVAAAPGAITGLNVRGRRPVGPARGFGPMWEKTYELRFQDARKTPFEIAAIMKENFVSFQPSMNRFYPSPAGIAAGETVLIKSSTMGIPIYTGVLTSYADDVSFTFMTPQGHPESGWVTFRVFREAGETVCQIQGLARASDPLFEVAFRLHGSEFQERIWKHVLGSLGRRLGVNAPVVMSKRRIAANLQWSQAGNIRHDAQIWTLAYLLTWPLRHVFGILRK